MVNLVFFSTNPSRNFTFDLLFGQTDSLVPQDILKGLNTIIPWDADYQHLEGNSAAHIKATLVGASQTIAIENNKLALGRWQGLFFCEFDGPRTRKVHIKLF